MTGKPRILIVEDERLISLDLSRRLPKLGYAVCAVVATGEEAVAKVGELKPDLVLMDICLHGKMDGIHAAEQIRQGSCVPVVFLTANSDPATLERAKLTQPSSYLLKPFRERELQIGIDMALLNHRLQRELQSARDSFEARVEERTAELARTNATLRVEIDIRLRMEAQAREQADLLAKARDAIYVRDLGGVISYWNRSAERLYGVAAANALGRRAPDLLDESGSDAAAQAERTTLDEGEWTGELSHRTRSGQLLTVESRWTLVRDDEGLPKNILVVNTDITERKRVAEQFMRTQRLESIGALASGIAHDLNNVFTPILLATELIADSPPSEAAEIVDMVRTTAQRGADMVKQVLMFVRGGGREMHPTSVGHLAQEVRRLMKETLPCTLRIGASIDKDLPFVNADETQLHQVLVNLCVNARDAMPNGGDLTIQAQLVDITRERAAAFEGVTPGPHVRLTVADTGVGMPPEVRCKIFDPFFTTKDIGKGTGLGLSTVASIVKGHRGFVEVDSQVGRGSQFHIYLPALAEAAEDASASKARATPRGRGELILVVDDEHTVREITKLTLEANNYRVLLASDGAEALSTFLQNQREVALVMTDVMMPIMNGRALIHALRKMSPGLPIVAFSAADKSDPLVGTIEMEGLELLRKPATKTQLLGGVAAALHPVVPVPELAAS